MHYFLGIDVGTYSSKGVLTDESGKVVSRAVTHHGMENPEPGYYEQDADKVWWNDFCILSKILLQQRASIPYKIAFRKGCPSLSIGRQSAPNVLPPTQAIFSGSTPLCCKRIFDKMQKSFHHT